MPILVVTTPRGLETVAASRLRDRDDVEEVDVQPGGYAGLLRVHGDVGVDGAVSVAETEKATAIDVVLDDPTVDGIAKACADVAADLPDGAAFAVRCTRRGSHEYASPTVEREAGTAVEAARPDLVVDLTDPDVIVRVEVVDDWVGVGRMDPDQVHRKYEGKRAVRELTKKTTVVQRLYEADARQGVDRVGAALGRSVQAFEVDGLVVAVDEPADADAVTAFLAALDDGIGSRHRVQQRSLDRGTRRVPVEIYELYQMARRVDRDDATVVMTDPRGEPVGEADGLGDDLRSAEDIFVFNGSNQGLPPGVFDRADHVLDLAPEVTYGTDQAATAALVGLVDAWQRADGR